VPTEAAEAMRQHLLTSKRHFVDLEAPERGIQC
jgi:hypothetical protein